jgi:hypothetical protein
LNIFFKKLYGIELEFFFCQEFFQEDIYAYENFNVYGDKRFKFFLCVKSSMCGDNLQPIFRKFSLLLVNIQSCELQVAKCHANSGQEGFWIFIVIYEWELQKWTSCHMKSLPPFVLLHCACFPSLCWLGYCLLSRSKGLVELCAIGQHPKVRTCSWVDISKTYTYTPQWESQGERLWVVSHVLIATMNLGVVIGVGNGQTWDKVTHQIWLLWRSYLTLKLFRHND